MTSWKAFAVAGPLTLLAIAMASSLGVGAGF
jgi:hypothetical protein